MHNAFLLGITRRIATSPQDEAFLSDILDQPLDKVVFAVYADWLDEQADPRGEYLRLALELWRCWEQSECPRAEIQNRMQELRGEINPLWLGFVLREGIEGTVTRV